MKILSTVLLICTLSACAQLPAMSGQRGAPIRAEAHRLQAHVEFLASDELRGRNTGTREYHIAAQYVAAQFQQQGLQPAGDDGSYLQEVPLLEHSLVQGSAEAIIGAGPDQRVLKYPEQFIMGPDRLEPEQRVSAEAVFVGYGIVSPRFQHDDYAAVDVTGKIAVVLSGRPEAWPTEEGAHLADGTEKKRYAAERGAVGIVVLHSPRRESVFPYLNYLQYLGIPGMSWVDEEGIPSDYFAALKGSAYFNVDAGTALFDGAPVALEDIFQADLDQQPLPTFALGKSLTLARKSRHEPLSSPNVVAVIPGSDPILKHEYLLYSGHLDHIGVIPAVDGGDEIYNGALDNAAGIATLLEAARVLQAERDSLRRSVMFLAVTGEEKGLLGSGYFARQPTVPIDSIVANINLDMPVFTYPFADVIAFGAEHSDLGDFVARAAAANDVSLAPDPMPEQGLFTRSDHYMLVREGVPAVMLATGFTSRDPERDGEAVFRAHLRDHYHQPSDDVTLPIDYDSGARFAEINIQIGREVCNGPTTPAWNEGDFFGEAFSRSASQQDGQPNVLPDVEHPAQQSGPQQEPAAP